jgi:hypothetical protein
MTTETTYRLSAEAWRAQAGRMHRRAAALVASTAFVVVAVWALVLRERGASPSSLVLPLVLLAIVAGLSHLRRMRRSQARWEGFRVRLGPDAIRRDLPGFPEVSIARGEITGVDEGPRGLAVRARERALFVPRQLEGYDGFRAALAAWRGGG